MIADDIKNNKQFNPLNYGIFVTLISFIFLTITVLTEQIPRYYICKYNQENKQNKHALFYSFLYYPVIFAISILAVIISFKWIMSSLDIDFMKSILKINKDDFGFFILTIVSALISFFFYKSLKNKKHALLLSIFSGYIMYFIYLLFNHII